MCERVIVVCLFVCVATVDLEIISFSVNFFHAE